MKRVMGIVVAVGFCLVTGVVSFEQAAYSHDGEGHSHGAHSASVEVSPTEVDSLKQIHRDYLAIANSISSKELSEVHKSSESLSLVIEALSRTLSGPDAARTTGLLNNLRKVADILHENADKGDLSGAEVNLKKMEAILKMIDEKFNFSFDATSAVPSKSTGHPHGEVCSDPDITINIDSKQYAFEPSLIQVKKGQRVCLKLTSQDVEHGIMIDGYHVHVHGTKDSPGEVQFVADRVGEFNFICHQVCGTGHDDMKGKLIVSE